MPALKDPAKWDPLLTPRSSLPVGVLSFAVGLAILSLQNPVGAYVGLAMGYGGIGLAFVGFHHWANARDTSRRLSRCLPRLRAVLDAGSITQTSDAIVGRFRNHWIEVTSDVDGGSYSIRLLLHGSRGLPWIVMPDGRECRLQSRSSLLEERLRQAGVVSLVAERPEVSSLAAPRSRWSVDYRVGHDCGLPGHSTSAIEYCAKPGPDLWRRIPDEPLRGLLGLLVELAEINRKVNVGIKADVDPPSGPPRWHAYIAKGNALAFIAVGVIILVAVAVS